jgi:hypothetical protein
MDDRSLAPQLAANERKCYQLYKHDAIALARRVAPALRDRAIGHLVDLCIDGGDEEEATTFFELVKSDFVRREMWKGILAWSTICCGTA